MPQLTIPQVADEINQRSSAFAIGALQQIRVRLKSLKKSSSRLIFSSSTTKETWACHHGGRSELQFNIGMENLEDGQYIRHGVAFSLETSRSLPSIDILIPKIKLFNEYVQRNSESLSGFEMWHFINGQRSYDQPLSQISADLIKPGVFIFLGSLQPIKRVDYDQILSDLDTLLPLYKFVESNGTVSPYKDSPKAFNFRAGHYTKKSATMATRTESELSVALRHNELQDTLYKQLCREYGKSNVGTEEDNGSGGRIDAVVKTQTGFIFFEIKVGKSLQACLREAIGQLIEYSYWPGSKTAISLVVVGEPPLDKECSAYLKRLKQELLIPISYRQIVCA